MAVIDKVLTGESLVVTEGGDNEIAHIDYLMGPRGSEAEEAFCNKGVIANPNCTTILLALILAPLAKRIPIKCIIIIMEYIFLDFCTK